MFDEQTISAEIGSATGEPFSLASKSMAGGGSINDSWHLQGQCGREFFLKLNRRGRLDMFVAEAEGLAELAAAGAIRVPAPVCQGETGQHCFSVLEYIPLGRGSAAASTLFGEQLARLHETDSGGLGFGWHRDNTIGSTHQPNAWMADWVEFLREQRLGYQLELAARNGCSRELRRGGQRLLDGLDFYFENYTPAVSLLHGDLWSGNYSFDDHDQPVIFDPATHFGDRESELAMTELFGGFPGTFYDAYERAWPLDPGYAQRRDLYKLYHVLNHFNMFGGGYASQSAMLLDKLLVCLP